MELSDQEDQIPLVTKEHTKKDKKKKKKTRYTGDSDGALDLGELDDDAIKNELENIEEDLHKLGVPTKDLCVDEPAIQEVQIDSSARRQCKYQQILPNMYRNDK